jgi:hypothetical protein
MAWLLPLDTAPQPSGTAVLPLVIVLLLAVAAVAVVLLVLRRLRR